MELVDCAEVTDAELWPHNRQRGTVTGSVLAAHRQAWACFKQFTFTFNFIFCLWTNFLFLDKLHIKIYLILILNILMFKKESTTNFLRCSKKDWKAVRCYSSSWRCRELFFTITPPWSSPLLSLSVAVVNPHWRIFFHWFWEKVERREGGERERCGRDTWIGCPPPAPRCGDPTCNPRYVPFTGIESGTLWCTGWRSNNWFKLARAK